MGTLTSTSTLLPKLKPPLFGDNSPFSLQRTRRRSRKNHALVPVARLFGPAIFEASKLKVLFLGTDEKKHPAKSPRTYTLTHSDITSKLTLAISQTINNSQLQGWYHKLQRDEVVAEWKKFKGNMSLHVHCHISGGHFLLDLFAKLRFYIFCKELPVVLKAFVHGDVALFKTFPELEDSLVWVYFHSNIQEFNKLECWGPLKEAASPCNNKEKMINNNNNSMFEIPQPCVEDCSCCFPTTSSITWTQEKNPIEESFRVSSLWIDNNNNNNEIDSKALVSGGY